MVYCISENAADCNVCEVSTLKIEKVTLIFVDVSIFEV